MRFLPIQFPKPDFLVLFFVTLPLIFALPFQPLPICDTSIRPVPHRILILQHFLPSEIGTVDALAWASIESHSRYAHAHGYAYYADTGEYVPRSAGVPRGYVNKLHALMRATLNELALGEDGCEWIM